MNKPLLKIQVPSVSVPGDWHTVSVFKNSITCDCVKNGIFHQYCSHIKKVEEILKTKNI